MNATSTTPAADTPEAPVVSLSPITLPAPGRPVDLQLRVSAPSVGDDLPIVLFAHGYGSSMRAYGPLTDYWASRGFAVIQPTFVDSRTVGVGHGPDDPHTPHLWRYRVDDMKRVLDHLDDIEASVPTLRGRLDRTRIAVAGHSFGGQTAGVLLGLRVIDPGTGHRIDLSDPRVKAGVLLATAGRGGADLEPQAARLFPWLNPDFAEMRTPALVVAGDADSSVLTTRGPDWSADPYHLSPGPKSLLTLFGAEHSLGGIPGYEAAETTDEDPARVAAVQRLTDAYLRSALYPEDPSWEIAKTAFSRTDAAIGRVESR
jgi:predicted dienelactone hydrolase